jgi:hypothetical protein
LNCAVISSASRRSAGRCHQGLLVAEESCEVGLAVLAFKAIVADDRAAGRQRSPLRRDALDVASQVDLLGEQRAHGSAW